MPEPRAGVIGLGVIGAGAARNILAAGDPLVAYDVRPDAIAALGAGVSTAESCADAGARSDVLLIAVYDDAQVRTVIGELLAGTAVPDVVVVLSTVTLDTIRWAERSLAGRGVQLIDCGVAGGPAALAKGTIVAMAGGSGDAFARARPVLARFADPVAHLGPVGAGMAAKLARNMITYAERVVVREAAVLAASADVDADAFLEVIKATDRWNSHAVLLDRGFIPGSSGDPEFARSSAGYAHKDLQAAIGLGEQLGVELPVTRLADELYPAAVSPP